MVVFAIPQQSVCCATDNSCVLWNRCFSVNAYHSTVDGDTDEDYCRSSGGVGKWYDCWDSGQAGCDVVDNGHGIDVAAYCDGSIHDCVAKKNYCASCSDDYECLGSSNPDLGVRCRSGKCRTTTNEAGSSMCSDGIDNDCDGGTDCADAGCAASCCGFEGNECCSGSSCDSGLYCDSGYCCDTGWYWDGSRCREGESECGLSGGSLCVSDISNFVNWYGDNDCYSQSSPFTGCCNVFQYNEWGYYDTSITTY